MAATLWRTSSQVLKRSLSLASVRCAGGPPSKPVDEHRGKVPSDEVSLPNSLGHSVGPERFELLAKESGDDDPFNLKVLKRTKGTIDEPTVVTGMSSRRTVGCICEEDSLTINWMILHKGEPKRCKCGYWFKLVDAPPKDY